MGKILLKRTNDAGKEFKAEELAYGEVVLKYSKEGGGLYWKNDEGEIEKIKKGSDISAEIDEKVSGVTVDSVTASNVMVIDGGNNYENTNAEDVFTEIGVKLVSMQNELDTVDSRIANSITTALNTEV